MRDKEFVDLSDAYKQIYEHVDVHSENNVQEEVDIYDQVLEYLLNEGYSEEESKQIMIEIINEAGLGSLIKGAKALAGFVAKRAKTPLRTAATDSLITSTALNPVSTAKIAKTIAKSTPSPAPIVRTVKATPVRTAPKGANKITTNVWNEPTAPSSRINPSKPSGPKVSSTKALSGTPSRPALPSAGKTSASAKPTFKPEALPKATKSAEPAGALVRTKAPKPTFKPEALPKVTKSAEPAGALVSTRAPKPTFKPEALPKVTKSAEPAGALVRTKAPKPTFKPEALPKATKSAEPAGELVSTRAPKPTFKPEAIPKATKSAEPAGELVSTRAPKPTFKPEAIPKATKSAEPAGALVRTKAPKPTENSSGGSTNIPKSFKGLKRLGATVAGATALGVGADMASPRSTAPGTPDKAPKFPTTAKEVKKGQTYYDPNTRIGTSQRFAQRKKVGVAKIGSSFEDAFKFYKERGDKTFKYAGKEYTTKMKENAMYEAKDETEEGITGLPIPKKKMSPKKRHEFEKKRRVERKKRGDERVGDTFSQHRMTGSRGHGSEHENIRSVREELLVDYLLGEGFASDEKSAQAIAGAMSEEWVQSIVEQASTVSSSGGAVVKVS
jgi:hypothetical protein